MVKLHCGEPRPCRSGLLGAPTQRDLQSHRIQARCGILQIFHSKRYESRNQLPSDNPPFPDSPIYTRGLVIVQPPQVEHHRWTPSDLAPKEHGLTPLDASTRALLRQMHWRKSPRDRRQVWLGLIVAVLLHAVFIVVIWREMRPPLIAGTSHAPVEEALQVRFISFTPTPSAPIPQTPPQPPSPSLPPKHVVVARVPPPPRKVETPAKDAMVIQSPTPKPAPTAVLFDRNGQPLLPSATTEQPDAPTPGYVQRMPQGDTAVMNHDNPIKYQETRFDGSWVRGNAVDQALQKVVDKATVKKTVRLPGGVRVHCAVFLLFGGCGGEAPSPPSAKDGDERLSMAPAKSLAPPPHPPTPPDIETCIGLYRDGQPLAWGCPVDTPNRAIDEEARERAPDVQGHR
ncbi:hypothetical protein [Rhodanobacter sp. L36]|uniref:hypothetical protein n=1 Tax=Rhodanobacter sp. L36 TaxID=1747221 RepID=UPI0020B12F84|nr:hypothetical protein [Rhodanobacter sp. L36]